VFLHYSSLDHHRVKIVPVKGGTKLSKAIFPCQSRGIVEEGRQKKRQAKELLLGQKCSLDGEGDLERQCQNQPFLQTEKVVMMRPDYWILQQKRSLEGDL